MSKINTFEELKVWQTSRTLNKRMFEIFRAKQDKNTGFLINHMFKTSGSIMDNT